MSEEFTPLRFFTPSDRTDYQQTIKTERELQLIKDIAVRNGMAIRVDKKIGKVFLGRSRHVATSSILSVDISSHVTPLAQSNDVSCGQTSVAMAINSMTGRKLRDTDIDFEYGFGLFAALVAKCPKHEWKDKGDMGVGTHLWGDIMASLTAKCPVVIFLNGMFSSTGRGHIVLITALTQTHVTYADPATGTFRKCTRLDMEQCAPHPDGKAVFAALPR